VKKTTARIPHLCQQETKINERLGWRTKRKKEEEGGGSASQLEAARIRGGLLGGISTVKKPFETPKVEGKNSFEEKDEMGKLPDALKDMRSSLGPNPTTKKKPNHQPQTQKQNPPKARI